MKLFHSGTSPFVRKVMIVDVDMHVQARARPMHPRGTGVSSIRDARFVS